MGGIRGDDEFREVSEQGLLRRMGRSGARVTGWVTMPFIETREAKQNGAWGWVEG